MPVITADNCRTPDSLKLATYFADLTKTEQDAKESRRNQHRKLGPIAIAYTNYIYQYVKQHQATGISRKNYRLANIVHLPEGDRKLGKWAFNWRLKEFLKSIGADHEGVAILPDLCPPILRLADDRLVNPGAKFTMADGPTLMTLCAMHYHPAKGYRSLTRLIRTRMNQLDFVYRGLWKCPTERQVRSLMEAIPDGLRTLLAEGYKAYYASFGLARTRSYGELNAYWAGDAFFFKDIKFFDPNDMDARKKSPGVSYLLECSCRFPVALEVHLESPTAMTGIKLIRDGVLPKTGRQADILPLHGKFDHLLSDGGVPLGTADVTAVVGMLGARHLIIPKGLSAQNAPAERFGGTSKVLIRAIVRSALYKEYPSFRHGQLVLPISQFDKFKEIVIRAINDYRYNRVHRYLKVTPFEALQAAIEKTGIKPVDHQFLMRITSLKAYAQVQKEGIQLHGQWFFSMDLQGLVGETVECLFDPFEKEKPSLQVFNHGEFVCTAPRLVPGTDSDVREALKGPIHKSVDAVRELVKALKDAEKRTQKPLAPSLEQARDAQRIFPELIIPSKFEDGPNLLLRLHGETTTSWRPQILADTHALRVIEQAARDVAGKNRVLAIKAKRGNGLTTLGRMLNARASQITLPGKVLHVEVVAPETGEDLPQQIAEALGIKASTKAAMRLLAPALAEKEISLLYVDNANYLPDKILTYIAGLPTQKPEQTVTDEQDLLSPPPTAPLGIILAAHAFTDDQIKKVREACDFMGIYTLPHLEFQEMAILLRMLDARFTPILKAAETPDSPEVKFLATFYAMTEGSFARFQYILGRLEPVLAVEGPLSIATMIPILDQYAIDTVPPKIETRHTVLP